ncbi:MAG TPA: hypothetical protein DHV28_13125 [Ignavibacteriales bacterium]|nr:hypothetical protein [Ignavibacteriales bacterium]
MKTQKMIRIFLLMLILSLIVSCSEDQTTAPAPSTNTSLSKFSEIKAKVFVNCLGAQCHSSSGNQGNLILEPDVAYNNLVGVQSVLFPQFKRVEAGNSANSLIIKILKGQVSPQMPLNGTPLPAATIDSIAKWIDLGALNN